MDFDLNALMGGMMKDANANAMPKKKKTKKTKRPDLSYEQLLEAPKSTIFEIRIRQAEVIKNAANMLYKSNDLEKAIKLYQRSLFHTEIKESSCSFDVTTDHIKHITYLRDVTRLNLGKAFIKCKKYRLAIDEMRSILKSMHDKVEDNTNITEELRRQREEADSPHHTPHNICTAQYILGKCYLSLDEYADSEYYFNKALTALEEDRNEDVDPKNKASEGDSESGSSKIDLDLSGESIDQHTGSNPTAWPANALNEAEPLMEPEIDQSSCSEGNHNSTSKSGNYVSGSTGSTNPISVRNENMMVDIVKYLKILEQLKWKSKKKEHALYKGFLEMDTVDSNSSGTIEQCNAELSSAFPKWGFNIGVALCICICVGFVSALYGGTRLGYGN